MALVNPQIAMSYRPTVEYQPRNALAEYAQVQQIVGGQRQAEMADMQMEALRRERDALGQIQAAIVAKGGPPDLEAAADAMIRTGRPEYLTQGMAIRTALRNQREAEAYRREFGGGAAAPSAAAAPANAMAAPAAAPAGEPVAAPMPRPTGTVRDVAPGGAVGPETSIAQNLSSFRNTPPIGTKDIFGGQLSQEDKQRIEQYPGIKDRYETYSRNAAFFLNTPPDDYYYRNGIHLLAEQAKELSDLTGVKLPGTVEELRQVLNIGQPAAQPPAAANALAPSAAPVTNAMVAPAAQPAAAVPAAAAAAAAPDANTLRLRALEAQYRRIGNNPELASEKALVLKQIEDVQATIRAENATPPEAKFMRSLGLPLTREGFAEFEALKQRPGEFERLLSQSGLSRADQTALIQQRARTMAAPTPAASVTVKLPPLEGAEQKGKGELNVKQYGEIATAARLAARTLPAMETQAKILDQGFSTGFGTEVKKAGASLLSALGVPEAEKFATDAQTFLAATQQAVLQRQLEQKGPQTEADAQRITQTGAQLGNTVNANRFIIDVAKAQLRRDIAQREFYDTWWSRNKTYEGAENAWFTGEGGKSLFDRPELKKYLAPAQGAAAGAAPAIPQAAINDLKAGRGTDAQFDAIFGAGAAKRVREGK